MTFYLSSDFVNTFVLGSIEQYISQCLFCGTIVPHLWYANLKRKKCGTVSTTFFSGITQNVEQCVQHFFWCNKLFTKYLELVQDAPQFLSCANFYVTDSLSLYQYLQAQYFFQFACTTIFITLLFSQGLQDLRTHHIFFCLHGPKNLNCF